MEKILNQDEIDALVRAARGGSRDPALATSGREIATCDFRASGQLTKEQIRSLTQIHEVFSRNLSHSLGAYLRIAFEVAMVSVEQLTFREFLHRVPDLAYFASFRVSPLNALGIVQVEMSLTLPMVDLLLGGRGRPEKDIRDLTEIEEGIYQSIVSMILRQLSGTWHNVGLGSDFDQRQPQSEVARVFGPTERVLALTFEFRMPEARGSVNIVVPAVASNSLLRTLMQRWTPVKQVPSAAAVARISTNLLSARFPVELALEAPICTRKLLEMALGEVVPFRFPANQPATVFVNNTPLFSAQAARHGVARAALIERTIASSPEQWRR
ncbi:MAG: FliM/FliN family flagellar motor switch protein [Acidobacteriia bacterium]|nr:FliM/FliN family flagellar motor switch protein [Terriglobia bacterium]